MFFATVPQRKSLKHQFIFKEINKLHNFRTIVYSKAKNRKQYFENKTSPTFSKII